MHILKSSLIVLIFSFVRSEASAGTSCDSYRRKAQELRSLAAQESSMSASEAARPSYGVVSAPGIAGGGFDYHQQRANAYRSAADKYDAEEQKCNGGQFQAQSGSINYDATIANAINEANKSIDSNLAATLQKLGDMMQKTWTGTTSTDLNIGGNERAKKLNKLMGSTSLDDIDTLSNTDLPDCADEVYNLAQLKFPEDPNPQNKYDPPTPPSLEYGIWKNTGSCAGASFWVQMSKFDCINDIHVNFKVKNDTTNRIGTWYKPTYESSEGQTKTQREKCAGCESMDSDIPMKERIFYEGTYFGDGNDGPQNIVSVTLEAKVTNYDGRKINGQYVEYLDRTTCPPIRFGFGLDPATDQSYCKWREARKRRCKQ